MKIAEIDFPVRLLNDLRDDKLVVFAGAGVSMGEPAYLPSFKHLAKTIAKGTGKTLHCRDPIDHFLGRLQDEGVKVHERAAEALVRENLKTTELHRNLLRLYSGTEQVRIVTTNFDFLFEQAAEDLFDSIPEVFRAPALPLGHQFKGIVHVHGTVNRHDDMIITDSDFGRAYLNEGWAQRFLVELFSNFTILFVGYSHNDTIMNYLARALPAREANRRFALTGKCDDDTDRWCLLGIEPITYPQCNKEDHSALDKGARELAAFAQLGILDWHRKITEIAENPPPLDKETEDLMKYALADDTKTRFFTKAATNPEWIDWLDEREYLIPLFANDTLNKRDRIFSWWLVEQFAHTDANHLFLLIGKRNMRLHPRFWYNLAYRIGRDRETSWDTDILSRWISLLLATAQGSLNTNSPGPIGTSTLLQWMGERCIQHERLDILLQIFDTMMEDRLQLREGYFWHNDDENNGSPPVDAELPLIGEDNPLNQLWQAGLKPKLSQVAEPLLNQFIKRLEERHVTLCTWQKADFDWEGSSDVNNVLIDAARDCLEWLSLNRVETMAWWYNQLLHSDAPPLRRLAIYGLSKREDLTADDKIDWLLTHVNLHERSIRSEVFQVVGLAYPEASPGRRQALIEAVRVYRWPDEEDSNKIEHAARQHFYWFNQFHQSDSSCDLARRARNVVLREYPSFDHPPDQTHGNRLSWSAMQTLWTPEELLATPAADWLDNLLSFQVREWDDPEHSGLIENVAEATRRNFDWGLDLANVLGAVEEWDVYLWSALIYAWSTMELSEDKYRKVFYWLGKTELHPKHNRKIAKVLHALVKFHSRSYALNLLSQANKIAAALWHHLDQPEPIEETDDWLRFAINYPAWDLANFWLSGFSLWRQHQDPRPTVLNEEYRTTLSGIVEDLSLSGKLGRAVLASDFAFLLAVDAAWTQEYILPLFKPASDDFQAAWSGFLTGGRLNPAVAEVMADPFLKAVEQINSDLFNQRDRFIKYYIYMFEYLDENPLDRWIPKFFQYASQEQPSETEESMLFPRNVQETKDYFAVEVGRRLQRMSEAEQQEWWQRWLKRYWKNRLQGVPAGELEPSETVQMLDWLPHLISVFPEVVDLAVQMPQGSLQDSWIIADLNAGDENSLWQKHPEPVAKLLIYLWKCDLPEYSWDSVQQLIDKLLPLDISPEHRRELQEIRIQL